MQQAWSMSTGTKKMSAMPSVSTSSSKNTWMIIGIVITGRPWLSVQPVSFVGRTTSKALFILTNNVSGCGCRQRPSNPYLTSCNHVYCQECLLELSHYAAKVSFVETSTSEMLPILTKKSVATIRPVAQNAGRHILVPSLSRTRQGSHCPCRRLEHLRALAAKARRRKMLLWIGLQHLDPCYLQPKALL